MAGRFAAGCRGTVPDPAQDMRPRFSLSWQRKAAAPGGKETAARGRHGPSRGDALTISNRCGVRFKSPAGCALPFSVWKCFPAFGGSGVYSGWLRTLSPSVSAAASPALGGGIQRRGPLPPPLSRFKGRSRRGKSKSPSLRLFWTGRGPFSPRGENGGRISRGSLPQTPFAMDMA